MKAAQPEPPGLEDFAALATLLPCGVVLLDRELQLRYATPAAAKLLGCEPAQLDGNWSLIRPQLGLQAAALTVSEQPLRASAVTTLGEKSSRCRFELYARDGGEHAHYLMLVYPGLPDALQGVPAIAAGHAMISAVLSQASLHDFSARLNTVKLTLTLLTTGAKRTSAPGANGVLPRWDRYLRILNEETDRLIQTLIEMRSRARFDVNVADEDAASLRLVLQDIQHLLHHEVIIRKQRLKVEAPADDGQKIALPSLAKHALLNLAVYLVENAPAGAAITLTWRPGEDAAKRAQLEFRADGDTGEMKLEAAREFFRPEFAIRPTDLGLLASRLIMAALGGTLTLSGGNGEVFGFLVVLPVV